MIISDTHRYLFVELPHTGTTAISQELRECYDGRKILHKHARYGDFLRGATASQRDYFVFSCIRNPLDEAVSIYARLRSDHRNAYSAATEVGASRATSPSFDGFVTRMPTSRPSSIAFIACRTTTGAVRRTGSSTT